LVIQLIVTHRIDTHHAVRQVDCWPGRFEHYADAADAGINIFDLGEKARHGQERAGCEERKEKSFHGCEMVLVM
jgi:hypothetical protein